MRPRLKIIISGGGTGGHIFPAISIANAIKEKYSDATILFVGAEGRMEMERVPAVGYKIIGLPVAGFNRAKLWKNVSVIVKLVKSLRMAKQIVKEFSPDIAIGVGGYASGPILRAASLAGVPTLLQEQNSYAGVTNKLLSKKADTICVAYDGMDRFFPKEKIVITGNPCRQILDVGSNKKEEAYNYFKLDPSRKTILIVGGSLGARTINKSISNSIDKLIESGVQIIWQCGKIYYEEIKSLLSEVDTKGRIHLFDFLSRMDLAYSVADLVISRAGAGTISELSLLGKPVILVPSPNVSEDHQTQNALALVKKDAAILVADVNAVDELVDQSLSLVNDDVRLRQLSSNILKMAQPDSANRIVDEIEKILEEKR